jgi:RimJ/RimL family protein N-acetyltransferase
VPGPEIITQRLSLSLLSSADAASLLSYRSLPEVFRYQTWEPQSLHDATAFIDGLASDVFENSDNWFQFGIRLLGSGELIGDMGVHLFRDEAQAEIGFTLAPSAQGQGFATEAVVALLDFLFGQLGKHRVFASVDPRNTASLRLLERVGMRQEAHFRESLFFRGEWVDDVVFAVLESEWVARVRPESSTEPLV